MIVTCPNCETRYNLPDEKVPAGGAKVKCSKCAQVFKAEHPPVSPEEEVEALLEKEDLGADTQAGEDFDETFDDMASSAAPTDEASTDEAMEEGLPDTDDLFDESDTDAPDSEETDSQDADDLFADEADTADADDLFADADDDTAADDLFADADDDTGDDDDLDEDGGESGDDVFYDGDADEDEDEDEDESGEDSLSLDPGVEKGNRKSLGCLILLLVLALGLGAAVYFKVWTYAGIDLGGMLKNVPFVGQMFTEDPGGEEAAPGESPAERVRKIELKNVKQYYVTNEKVGNLFVVEGKAVNKFAKPKEQIKVEVTLYDATNNVLTSQAFLCGNVLSQFQLQVQTEKEIKDGLASEIGVLSNNTFIRPGASTPFMAVFFQPPTDVKEFMVKVVDVGDPE
ncbi:MULTISPECIES: DUF3426 domain-containing protein [unclassified Pseudodesulfovibrio]|uniref:DUF3426 domain-containing protein n=1 Tax=unclassified Pseudodesulfovibrio TaxID=2661612 RepID=UPI000FEB74C2|nr:MULTISPECIES: DUF3426 domain-containing protein [unclassified Pseudodesulfovibrio]MCJ2166118.1 zinc-ribbon domain-containing protein [Pseudodesulfovibrio sp. S3-i]RWU02412.1 DUF3426 domain-containing protein [Pseudodesulfovibrio sp. S3]